MSYKILNRQFFCSKNTVKIAKSLLGKFLVRRYKGKIKAYMITEVEAYDGFHDKASHAHRKKTERNKIMFGPAGRWYIYFTYGMHWMLNIVTGPKNYPAAILIRGIVSIIKISDDQNIEAVIFGSSDIQKLNGPAKITKALKINKNLNGKPVTPHPWKTSATRNSRRGLPRVRGKSGLWIEAGGTKIKPNQIKSAPRIGVGYAGPVWSKRKLRFYI